MKPLKRANVGWESPTDEKKYRKKINTQKKTLTQTQIKTSIETAEVHPTKLGWQHKKTRPEKVRDFAELVFPIWCE